jgi:hypothetical protein
MAFNITPQIGFDITNPIPFGILPTNSAGTPIPPVAIGTEVFGSDGKRYVFAKANASITASTAVCTVNAATFLATASGGSYTSPATNMVTGDYGWFGAASV